MKEFQASAVTLGVIYLTVALIGCLIALTGCSELPQQQLEVYSADKLASDIRNYNHLSVDEHVWHFSSNDELKILRANRYNGTKKESMYFHVEIECIKT